jgi:signal transduction histidine kinase
MAKKSLVQKITMGSTLLIVCAFSVTLVANYVNAYIQANAAHKKQLERQLNLLSQSMEAPLWSLDDNAINLIGGAYVTGTEVVSLKVFSQHRKEAFFSKEREATSKVIYGEKDVVHNGQVIGHVSLGLSGASYAASLSRLLLYSIFLVFIIVVSLAFLMKKLFREHLVVPLESLAHWTERIASRDYAGSPPQIELEELSSLVNKFSDMAEKIQSREKSLQASEGRFRGLFENTEVSIWNEDVSAVIDVLEGLRKEGVKDLRQHLGGNPEAAREMASMVKVIQVNEATLSLFGAKSHDDMLANIDKTFGPNTIEVFIDELCAIWDKEKSFRSKVTYLSLDGKELNTIISFYIPETMEGFSSLPLSIFDITDLTKAEVELVKYRDQLELLVEEQTQKLKEAQSELLQRERLATLGKVTAMVSHELRNPLGTIQTSLFSVVDSLERNDPSIMNRSITLAERSIDRCVTIIEELNSYARVKTLTLSEASLDDWLKEVFAEQTIPSTIHSELSLSSGVRAWFDQGKLRQVVVNLIDNAVHALQDGRAEKKQLEVSTRPLDGKYEIRIADNGVGMSEETKERVFEPLFSTKGFGVGLGMVIVKNLVEQHHGQINIESKLGEGTAVILRLPIHLTD